MAKIKAEGTKVETAGRARRDKVAEAEAQLRAYHALGVMVRDRLKEARLDAATVRKLCDETGHGADNIRKSRVFEARYTADQLDELCQLRTPEGMPLPWRHVRQLLMLMPGEGRDSLQRKAAERGWSLEELVAAIPKKVRRAQTRREGGRAFRGPRSLADGLRQIVRHGEEWLRRFGSRAWAGDGWLEGKTGAAGHGGLKARLAEAQEALRKVRESAAELERRLRRFEAGLGDGRPEGSATAGHAGSKVVPGRGTRN